MRRWEKRNEIMEKGRIRKQGKQKERIRWEDEKSEGERKERKWRKGRRGT